VVVGVKGTDPKLKKELLLSGHQDHDGVRQKIWSRFVYNGADDNASTCLYACNGKSLQETTC
jgi:hypothetical protein